MEVRVIAAADRGIPLSLTVRLQSERPIGPLKDRGNNMKPLWKPKIGAIFPSSIVTFVPVWYSEHVSLPRRGRKS